MLKELRDWREPRDWKRIWRDPPGWRWCCCEPQILLLVATHSRYTVAEQLNAFNDLTETTVNGAWSSNGIDPIGTPVLNGSDNSYGTDIWDSDAGLFGDILELFNLGLSVPTTATINGITVTIERKANVATNLKDKQVILIHSGATVGSDKASATQYTTSDVTATYGGVADGWSAGLTPAMVNDPSFGLRFQAQASTGVGNVSVSVDRITISVRYTIPAAMNVTAFDGTNSGPEGPGAPLWQYDTGLAPLGGSNQYILGKPIIDADGNIYIPADGAVTRGATNTDCGILVKLDRDGVHQWTYTSGTSADGTWRVVGLQFMPACAIDPTDGNIILAHPITSTGGFFLTKVDAAAGTMVTQYDFASAQSPGGGSGVNASSPGVVVDDSGQIFFIEDNGRVVKLDSSGDYVSHYNSTSTGGITSLVINAASDKLYVGFNIANAANTNSLFAKLDIAAMTADWELTEAEIEATAVGANSFASASVIGLDSTDTLLLGGFGYIRDTTPATLSQWGTINASGSVTAKNKITGATIERFNCGTIDPVTDTMFVMRQAASSGPSTIYRLGGGLGTVWMAHSVNGTAGISTALGIAARTI